jgi:hypothetical protein
LEGW